MKWIIEFLTISKCERLNEIFWHKTQNKYFISSFKGLDFAYFSSTTSFEQKMEKETPYIDNIITLYQSGTSRVNLKT